MNYSYQALTQVATLCFGLGMISGATLVVAVIWVYKILHRPKTPPYSWEGKGGFPYA